MIKEIPVSFLNKYIHVFAYISSKIDPTISKFGTIMLIEII